MISIAAELAGIAVLLCILEAWWQVRHRQADRMYDRALEQLETTELELMAVAGWNDKPGPWSVRELLALSRRCLMRRVAMTVIVVVFLLAWGSLVSVSAQDVTSGPADVVDVRNEAKPWVGDATADDVLGATTELVDASRTGKVVPIASALIFLLLSICKTPVFRGLLYKWIPKRWYALIPVVLGVAFGVLYAVTTGVSWMEALSTGLLSGGGAIALHEVLVEAVGGKNQTRTAG